MFTHIPVHSNSLYQPFILGLSRNYSCSFWAFIFHCHVINFTLFTLWWAQTVGNHRKLSSS